MPKYPKEDVPGDTIASARAVTEYWYGVGRSVGDLDRYREIAGVDQPELLGLRVSCDASDERGVLIVVKGLGEDGYLVAFHRGESIVEALQGVANRLKNHTLKWKEDVYAKDK